MVITKNKKPKNKDSQDSDYSFESNKRRILNKYSSFASVEAYKAARTNLLFTRSGEGCQKVALTSSFEAEGKSVNCINLAITLAQNNLRVLLIDCDMRRPVDHKTLGFKEGDGLSELLAGLVDRRLLFEENGLIHATWQENFSLLPAGHTPPNPAEMLASKQMESLVAELEPHYDYILFDTPPINVVTDALVLKKLVDGYVFVVRAGHTLSEGLRAAITRMEQVEANILGLLLNDVDEKSSYRKYYRKRYGYGYGYGKYGRYGSLYSRYSSGNHAAKATKAKNDTSDTSDTTV